MIELRPYQQECIKVIESADKDGTHRQLVALPTGTGKTILFSTAAKRRNGRTLILAHRDELIQQAVDKLTMVWDNVSAGVVKAERNETDKQVVVGSVQTVSRENRLEQLPQDFDFIVSDEAHHCHIPGTQVLTAWRVRSHALGNRGIEYLKVGQRVYGFDGDGWGLYKIVDTFKYKYDGLIYDIALENGSVISVTPNHQLYAKGRKKYASQIQCGETLSVSIMQLDNNKSSSYSTTSTMASPWKKTLSQMLHYFRESGTASTFDKTQKRECAMSRLWQAVRETFDRWAYQYETYQQQNVFSGSSQTRNEEARREQEVSSLSFSTNEGKQSDDEISFQRKNDENNMQNGRLARAIARAKLI